MNSIRILPATKPSLEIYKIKNKGKRKNKRTIDLTLLETLQATDRILVRIDLARFQPYIAHRGETLHIVCLRTLKYPGWRELPVQL